MLRCLSTPLVRIGALALSAPLLLAACGSQPVITRTETVEVKVPVKQPVPKTLLDPTPVPLPPKEMTNALLRDYAEDVLGALATCNADKDAVSKVVVTD